MAKRGLFSGLLLALLAASPHALAQTATGFFKQGRDLVEKGQWADACPLFVEARRLEPQAVGILLNVAECYKHTGKTASAWNAYNDAEFLAKKNNDTDRAQFAHNEAAALEPKLSRLRVNASDVPGLAIRRDDADVPKGLWGTALPVDPGQHKIEATAPGYSVWTTVVKIGPERDLQAVEIPMLAKAAQPWGAQRVAGIAVGGVGLAGLAVGAVLGGVAISKNKASKADCLPNQPSMCHAEGVSLRQTAGKLADASTGAFIVGGAALATGIVVFFTSRANAKTGEIQRFEVAPAIGIGTGELRLRGEW